MNVENKEERRLDEVGIVNQEVQRISVEKVRTAVKRMKNEKAAGLVDIVDLEKAWDRVVVLCVQVRSGREVCTVQTETQTGVLHTLIINPVIH